LTGINDLVIRDLKHHEVQSVWTIDRSEIIDRVYHHKGGELILENEHYNMTGWPPGEPDQYGPILDDCFNRGGIFIGAFHDGRLVGTAVLDIQFIGQDKNQLQLKLLHVSREFRKKGLGRVMFDLAVSRARELDARLLYISATPSENTVNFYLHLGCCLTTQLDAALFELEPEDIHLEFHIPE